MHNSRSSCLTALLLVAALLLTSACGLASWRESPPVAPTTPTPTALPSPQTGSAELPIDGLFGVPSHGTLLPPANEVSYWLDPQVNRASNDFGLELIRTLADQSELQNMMISPVSLMMALGMTAEGAAGQTQAEMLAALELEGLNMLQASQGLAGLTQMYADRALPVTLAIANALWLDEGTPFDEVYLFKVARYYDADLTTLPMNNAAVERINAWVRSNTLGKIDKIISPPMARDTVLVLTNAIYFEGRWRAPFDPEQTAPRPFHTLDGGAVETPTMEQTGRLAFWEDAGDAARPGMRVLAMPYGDSGDLQMWVMLPEQMAGLPELLANLSADDLARISQELAPQEVYVALPKFKSEYEATLNGALKTLGMAQAFTSEADFSGMSPQGSRFYISEVRHKSAVTVDEEGTVAAAASSVEIKKESLTERQTFIVDHPFLYCIWDGNAETLLFVGTMVRP